MTYRVGCVPYLNAKPLVRLFEDFKEESPVQVVYDVPSRLPAMLATGDVQAIMVSSIEALRVPGKRVADGVSISTQKEVLSVRLFSKVPPRMIRTVAFDQSSMTSNALAQVVLRERYERNVEGEPLPPSLEAMLENHDACVLIGDNGMRAEAGDLHILDLGYEWRRLTRLPFVWALWMGDEGLTPELSMWLYTASLYGMAKIERVVKIAAEETGFTVLQCDNYLRRIMDYSFDEPHREGLQQFGHHLYKMNLVKPVHFPAIVGADFAAVEAKALELSHRAS
ncbi:MAG TPA: menaquinone biosynthesis protein [Fimbriimonadaceae bacterium]|nr:menaquinone biosynthesis protein [Fimbriimonadaceae bacterium]